MSAELVAQNADFTPLARDAASAQIIERIEAAGIVGMGGGGYPTARKIREAVAANADWVIGNGMASEPGVTADAALLREHADEVTAGLDIVARCTGATHTALAVPNDSDVRGGTHVGLAYPAGEEKKLVAHLAGREVPAAGYASDVGVLVLNVSTLFAIHDAVVRGRALRQRLVTVAGTDRWVGIGTPVADLLQVDGYRIQGELTGCDAPPDAVVAPTTFSVDLPRPASWACIRCGWCADACPETLAPERLHRAFEAAAADATVLDCIECGACTAACPSRLDLVNEFRAIKTRMRREEIAVEQAERARQRSAARTERLARAANERDRQRAERMNKPRQW